MVKSSVETREEAKKEQAVEGCERPLDYLSKLEMVFRAYERSFDLDIALTIVPLTEAERLMLAEDEDLAARIALCDASQRENLMMDLMTLSKDAVSEGVKLAALRELGKMIYPRRFKEQAQTGDGPRKIMYEAMEPLE